MRQNHLECRAFSLMLYSVKKSVRSNSIHLHRCASYQVPFQHFENIFRTPISMLFSWGCMGVEVGGTGMPSEGCCRQRWSMLRTICSSACAIERNPVRAGMAARPSDCVCPGYQANVVGKADASVNRHSVYRSTGNGGQAAHVANEWRIILWPVFGNPQCSAPVQIQP